MVLDFFVYQGYNRSLKKLVCVLCTLAWLGSSAQIFDDFSDGDLTVNPEWLGDIPFFITNQKDQLQLNATDAGTSALWFAYTADQSLTWEIDLGMNFAPSNNNNVMVALYVDQPTLDQANGYVLKIGENGSDDTVELYLLQSGEPILIGSGEAGLFADKPVLTKLSVRRDEVGNWTVSTDKDFCGTLFREFRAFDDQVIPNGEGYFAIQCKYTKSNVVNFNFDNVRISPVGSDTIGPKIINVTVESASVLVVQFDEILDAQSATLVENYMIEGIGQPTSIELIDQRKSMYKLTYSQMFSNGSEIVLSTQVKDQDGNERSDQVKVEVLIAQTAHPGDLKINELLFNPFVGGSDFIEIINVSEKYIGLNHLSIVNNLSSSHPMEMITSPRIIRPKEIIVFTENPDHAVRDYTTIDLDQMIKNDLPGFNADAGNAMLVWQEGSQKYVLDSFNYSEQWHHPLLSNPKGVSLERISTSLPTVRSSTWASAAGTVGFATPGLPNSQQISLSAPVEEVTILNPTFSPDNDGFEDFLNISIDPAFSGVIGRVRIFDSKGHGIKEIENNTLFGSSQVIRWDGTNDQGQKARTGAYLVKISYFDKSGNRKIFTKTVVLASVLDD